MTTAPSLTALDILRAAAAVIRTRGYYQPLTRQWEPEVPTAMDVERWLFGRQSVERGDHRRFAAQSEAAEQEAAACLAWCQAGGRSSSEYRTKLARLTAAEHVTERDIPLLCSAVTAHQREQRRVNMAAERAADADHSRHQAAVGERASITAAVVAVINLGDRTYGYREQTCHLIKFRDADRNVYTWKTTTPNIPARDDSVRLTGTVSAHGHYQGTAETVLTRCRWSACRD